jgi:AGCS family alanine or glycine:cation symporter
MTSATDLAAQFEAWLNAVDGFVWGPAMLVLLLGTGLYLTIGMGLMPIRRIPTAFRLLARGRRAGAGDKGDITPFQSLMTALSATIGNGNIVGVAAAIAVGGPGAVFWMWMTALVGMATKYSEAVLAVRYREVDADGRYVGGPMYYIKNGLGRHWAWLGFVFAFFATIAGFGIGNMFQAKAVVDVVTANFNLPDWLQITFGSGQGVTVISGGKVLVGLAMAALTFLVIVGGVKRIGQVAEFLVPFMAAIYILGGLAIIAANIADVPAGLAFIVHNAFTPTAAAGGFAGAAVWKGIQYGVARGIFSNEAGLGSAPIAHAAARTHDPVRQGMIAMLGTFIDTIVVCTITALVIVTVHVPVTGADGATHMMAAWQSGQSGADLSMLAFNSGVAGGRWIVMFGSIIFAYTTILGWSYYGERAAEYLFGVKVVTPYRYLWVAFVFIGSVLELKTIITVADIMNALMAIPNLIALLLLSGTIFALTRASRIATKGDLDAPAPVPAE